mmetsp:Transcript_5744/g.17108  ORF Transcript_5744/g.17108 Transcript_5744/m.17108 type:complete len:228 (-) Transcript_5744:28-711(-)
MFCLDSITPGLVLEPKLLHQRDHASNEGCKSSTELASTMKVLCIELPCPAGREDHFSSRLGDVLGETLPVFVHPASVEMPELCNGAQVLSHCLVHFRPELSCVCSGLCAAEKSSKVEVYVLLPHGFRSQLLRRVRNSKCSRGPTVAWGTVQEDLCQLSQLEIPRSRLQQLSILALDSNVELVGLFLSMESVWPSTLESLPSFQQLLEAHLSSPSPWGTGGAFLRLLR